MFHLEQFSSTKDIGNFGQFLAYSYLINKNYIVLGQNIRLAHDEIDIIAQKEHKILIIEVKTRLSKTREAAEYHLSAQKIKRMKRAALNYATAHTIPEEHISLQGIAVQIDTVRNIANIKHYLSLI